MTEHLHFKAIEEHCGSYTVYYDLPRPHHRFAILSLTFLEGADIDQVPETMEAELRRWLARYPVPLMIRAEDFKANSIHPRGKPGSCLVGWIAPGTKAVTQSWTLGDLDAFVDSTPSPPDWRTIYVDVPFETNAEVKTRTDRDVARQRKQVRFLKILFVFWAAVLPACIAALEFWGPEWIGVIALICSFSIAWDTGLKIWGRKNPTQREKEKAEKQRRMEHYFYHCERNPDGFLRLKSENFEKDAIERVRKEAEELAPKKRVQ